MYFGNFLADQNKNYLIQKNDLFSDDTKLMQFEWTKKNSKKIPRQIKLNDIMDWFNQIRNEGLNKPMID